LIEKELIMKLLKASLLVSLLFVGSAVARDSNVSTAVGGGLGGAAGTAIGGVVGGSTGEVVGGAVGGGLGGAATTKGRGQTGAIVGGALGGGGGAYVGRQVTGTSTGAVVGAGLGGAGGATVGKVIDEPGYNDRGHRKGKHHKHNQKKGWWN
jgi:hypothetical protein